MCPFLLDFLPLILIRFEKTSRLLMMFSFRFSFCAVFKEQLRDLVILSKSDRQQNSDMEQIPKNGLSSDCRLQPACTKSESLVIAGQHTAVNTFPGLVHTARHTTEAVHTRSRWGNRKGLAVQGGDGDWGEVVTR